MKRFSDGYFRLMPMRTAARGARVHRQFGQDQENTIESIRRGIQDIRKRRTYSEEDFLEMYEDLA